MRVPNAEIDPAYHRFAPSIAETYSAAYSLLRAKVWRCACVYAWEPILESKNTLVEARKHLLRRPGMASEGILQRGIFRIIAMKEVEEVRGVSRLKCAMYELHQPLFFCITPLHDEPIWLVVHHVEELSRFLYDGLTQAP